MTPEDLIDVFREEASARNIEKYKAFLNQEPGLDEGWNLFRKIVLNLDNNEQKLMFSFVKLVQNDSIASVLSILDNQTYPVNQIEDFLLFHGNDQMNGDLCDIFWEKEEESWRNS